jgi:pilus assembly protein FimV
MRRVIKISSLLAALLLVSGEVLAAGLGKLTVSSTLGQPLRAEIELLSVSPEDMGSVEAKLAGYEAYRQAHIERTGALSDLRMSVEKRANGQPVVRISSSSPVNDPFVDLLVELNWSSGRILREYTILLDPAPAQKQEASTPVLPSAAPVATSSAPATKPTAVPAVAKPASTTKPAATANGTGGGVRTYGPVKEGETLRGIAGKLMPADVSLEMMMASLYHSNPKAFASNNMNLLKRGQVLKVPDRDSVMRMYSPHQARQLVQEQVDAWHAMQNRVADQAAQAKPDQTKAASAESGKIVPAQPQEKAPSGSASQDVLKLSKGEPFKSAADANKRIQSLQEEVATKDRALQDAQSRVGQLEKTVADLQHLMDLKAKEGAQTPAEGAAQEAAPAQPTPPVAKPAVKPPVAPPPVEEPGFFSSLLANPLYIAGALGALVVAGLLWVFMVGSRRRKGLSSFEQSIMTGGDQFKTSIFKTGGGAATERAAVTQSGATTDFSRLGLGSIDTHEVDPIAEAEVYMAYGRDAQAEEILKEALTKEPQRHEIMLKLLEIYASRQDAASFETQASELYASLGDPAGSMWQKAAEMGRSIDPNNPLYRVYGEVPELPTVAPLEPEETGPSTATHEFSAEPAELAVTEAEKAVEPVAEESDSHVMDFEMPEPLAPAPIEEIPESLPKTDLGGIALDFEPEDMTQIPSFRPEEGEHTEFPVFGETVEQGLEPMEEIHIPAAAETELPEEPQALEPAEELGELDLMAELPAEPEVIELPAAVKPEESAVELPDLDFSGIDLELNEAPEALPEPVEAETAIGIEAPASIDPDLFEEVNTKLDLAKAYLEMGDKEGAREILGEVLKEGDAQQQQQANDLMAEIG